MQGIENLANSVGYLVMKDDGAILNVRLRCTVSLVAASLSTRGGTIPEITMRYVSRYLSHDTIRITILH